MSAAKHTDPIVGMDMHMIQPPPPAPPLMVPHPVAGMVMDPADYSAGACTVFINGLPRGNPFVVDILTLVPKLAPSRYVPGLEVVDERQAHERRAA